MVLSALTFYVFFIFGLFACNSADPAQERSTFTQSELDVMTAEEFGLTDLGVISNDDELGIDEKSQETYGKPFSELTQEEQDEILY